jgi:hypothetical protein|tara:strand:+ start:366 stop:665 length:300 start_codon:yes stop_codon:yes gene_type:complete
MSTLTIDANAKPIQVLRPTSTSKIAISGTSNAANSIATGVRVARIVATVGCFYKIVGPAAVTDAYLPAHTIEYIHVYGGENIAVITEGGTGSAYITDMV